MRSISLGAAAAAAVVTIATSSCGSAQREDAEYTAMVQPGVVAPADGTERAILTRLASLPVNEPTSIGGARVVAGEFYDSASGRLCRSVEFGGGESRPNLACIFDGSWAFVPNISVPVGAASTPAIEAPASDAAPAESSEVGK